MTNEKNIGDLIRLVQCGDEDAFNEVYRRYHKLVYYIAYELCRNDADAQDILQETFLQIKRSIHTLKEPDVFKPWLNRIVVNKCKNLFRSRKTVELDADGLWYQQHVQEERTYMLPKEQVRFESDQKLVQHFLNCLSESQRIVLYLFYFCQMSIKDIAEALEVPEGTVKTRMMYGKNNLKQMIEAYEAKTATRVNFHVDDLALASLFLYGYECMSKSSYGGKWFRSHHVNSLHSSHMLMGSTILGLSVILVTASVLAMKHDYNRTKEASTLQYQNTTTEPSHTGAKRIYFQLMDWACCKEDMLQKSKEDFERIMPLYQKMKADQSEYFKRLIQDKWSDDFETIYHNL